MKDVTDAAHTCFAFPFRNRGWGNVTHVINHAIIKCPTRCFISFKDKSASFLNKIYFDN